MQFTYMIYIIETINTNVYFYSRGDIARLQRCTAITTGKDYTHKFHAGNHNFLKMLGCRYIIGNHTFNKALKTHIIQSTK